MRRYGRPVANGHKYSHRPGVYAILMRGSDVLLTWQGGIHNEFQLPGGGIDPGETPLPALHREVYEETGWHMARPVRLGAFRRFAYMPEYDLFAEKLCHIYLAEPTRRIGPPPEPEHEAVWVPRALAPVLLAVDGDRDMLRGLLATRFRRR